MLWDFVRRDFVLWDSVRIPLRTMNYLQITCLEKYPHVFEMN